MRRRNFANIIRVDMFSEHPLSPEQIRQMFSDLNEMKLRAEEMAKFARGGFGAEDQRTIRAEELVAAIQRMQWAIEREGSIGASGGH